MWARVLLGAPTQDLGLLAAGISAFVAEVAWFDQLEQAADRALAGASAAEVAAAADAAAVTFDHEAAFWAMTWDG